MHTGVPGKKLDGTLISALKSKDHTAAVKKIRISLVSSPSRSVWTSTSRTVNVPMLWRITDPKMVAERIRICVEAVQSDDVRCKTQDLQNYRKSRGDFWMKRLRGGWDVFTAPYYKSRSPYDCSNLEYYRPRIRWTVSVVDPRNGNNAVTGRFGWTVRCSG
jgi:hypothetical protein